MQQTKKYNLNLIEPSDTFSPDALNANTQKVEDVLVEKMEGPVVDLEQRVTVLEGFRFTCGNSNAGDLHLGFKPLVAISSNNTEHIYVSVEGRESPNIPFLEDGFHHSGGSYIAFGKI